MKLEEFGFGAPSRAEVKPEHIILEDEPQAPPAPAPATTVAPPPPSPPPLPPFPQQVIGFSFGMDSQSAATLCGWDYLYNIEGKPNELMCTRFPVTMEHATKDSIIVLGFSGNRLISVAWVVEWGFAKMVEAKYGTPELFKVQKGKYARVDTLKNGEDGVIRWWLEGGNISVVRAKNSYVIEYESDLKAAFQQGNY